ncbi:PH domain-containing protein [Polymorphospora sp. NPDC050346]|uniref:PH domain-containing protein n=1 Tax=Polymorphospora sp. NPDC050346 TaxID=3155780 RepID=UPI0033F4920E
MTGAEEHPGGPGEEAAWHRLDGRTLVVTAIYLIGWVLAAGGTTAFFLLRGGVSTTVVLTFVGGPALLIVVGGVLVDLVNWRYEFHRVTDQRIEKKFDFVFRTHKSVARDRVRSVDVNANVIYRMLGVARVKVGTGQQDSFGEVVISFDPVDRTVAEQMRRELLRKSPEDTEQDDAAPLARFRWAWLRYAPLSIATPILGASAFGAVMQAAEWFSAEAAVISWVGDLFDGVPLIVMIAALAGIGMVVGSIGALALWIELWWSYRLTRESGTLLVRRGLVTSRSLTLEERRLRGIELVEPIGARLSGGARLDAVATGLALRADDQRSDPRTLLPTAPRALAHRVAAAILREPVNPTEAVQLTGHPPVARRRRLGWAVAAVAGFSGLLALLGALLTDVLVELAWISAVLLLPVGIGLALDAYRNLGHGITGGYLVARRGTIRRSTVALLRDGVVGWQVTSSPMQRRVGLVTLTATTAANHGAYRIPDIGQAQGLAFADTAVPGLLGQFLESDDDDEVT